MENRHADPVYREISEWEVQNESDDAAEADADEDETDFLEGLDDDPSGRH